MVQFFDYLLASVMNLNQFLNSQCDYICQCSFFCLFAFLIIILGVVSHGQCLWGFSSLLTKLQSKGNPDHVEFLSFKCIHLCAFWSTAGSTRSSPSVSSSGSRVPASPRSTVRSTWSASVGNSRTPGFASQRWSDASTNWKASSPKPSSRRFSRTRRWAGSGLHACSFSYTACTVVTAFSQLGLVKVWASFEIAISGSLCLFEAAEKEQM